MAGEAYAHEVQKQQGNWLESRLTHLGEQFAGLVLIEIDKQQVQTMTQALQALSGPQLEIRVEPCQAEKAQGLVAVSLVSNDKPGIILEISQCINRLGANVESLESWVEAAPMSGGQLFKAELKIALLDTTQKELQDALEGIANDLVADISVSEG